MKIVIAPDKFKGSLSATEAARAMAAGARRGWPGAQVVAVPLADGGEGTTEALVTASGGRYREVEVTGPMGERVRASYGILGEAVAVIEMACAAGLWRVPAAQRDPLRTTSYGVGEVIRDALDQGCGEFVVGLGGSATVELGCGMAQALGVRFVNRAGREVCGFLTGGMLAEVEAVDVSGLDERVKASRFRVACDVRNPLLGPGGAARVYGPQKGASPAGVEQLETNLSHVIGPIEVACGRQVRDLPGAGAAGGMGAGLVAFLGAELVSGSELVLKTCGFREKAAGAGLILTGEGQVDGSTAHGKTVAAVADVGREVGAVVVALAGTIGEGVEGVRQAGVWEVVPICPGPMSFEEAMAGAAELVEAAAERAVRLMRAGQELA